MLTFNRGMVNGNHDFKLVDNILRFYPISRWERLLRKLKLSKRRGPWVMSKPQPARPMRTPERMP